MNKLMIQEDYLATHAHWEETQIQYQSLSQDILKKVQSLGATHAEISVYKRIGFSTEIRMQAVDTISYHQDKGFSLTVYYGHRQGQSSSTDFSPATVEEVVQAACRIARLSPLDKSNGLADIDALAYDYPDLDLYHPWNITPTQAVILSQQCEQQALESDARIVNSEGVSVETAQNMVLYANTRGFTGTYLTTLHDINCSLIAKEKTGLLQQAGNYTISRDYRLLQTIETLAKEAGRKVVSRLDPRKIKTTRAPVIFYSEIASSLINYFLKAILGSRLYRESSFLLGKLDQKVFVSSLSLREVPHIARGLGSLPFDAEGVKTQNHMLVENGILKTYLLNSYSARRLGLKTTGHASGVSNIELMTEKVNFKTLLQRMDTGLLITDVMGSGINLITGDYSQGVAGFWVEKGEIQYPVHEITIAGNLQDMYQNIVGVGDDIDVRSKIQTGSILIESMQIAGA